MLYGFYTYIYPKNSRNYIRSRESHRNNIILSEFLNTLLSLKNKTNTTDAAKLIKQKISHSTSKRSNISLIRILGHSNIEGNKKANEESKKTAESPNIPKLNILHTQIKNKSKIMS